MYYFRQVSYTSILSYWYCVCAYYHDIGTVALVTLPKYSTMFCKYVLCLYFECVFQFLPFFTALAKFNFKSLWTNVVYFIRESGHLQVYKFYHWPYGIFCCFLFIFYILILHALHFRMNMVIAHATVTIVLLVLFKSSCCFIGLTVF